MSEWEGEYYKPKFEETLEDIEFFLSATEKFVDSMPPELRRQWQTLAARTADHRESSDV